MSLAGYYDTTAIVSILVFGVELLPNSALFWAQFGSCSVCRPLVSFHKEFSQLKFQYALDVCKRFHFTLRCCWIGSLTPERITIAL